MSGNLYSGITCFAKKEFTMYTPMSIDTSSITLPKDLEDLTEQLAENTHNVWAASRIMQGWTYGPERNDLLKTTPCLIPYNALPEEEKNYDRNTAMEALKVIIKLGYTISK